MSSSLPKKIWMYWDQGFANAPELVKLCAESWQRHNDGWDVILLNESSVKDYFDITTVVDINRSDIKIQHVSDLIRINLLAMYGGVWADATCLCRKPLDEWLEAYMTTGFFAFRHDRRDRMLANWFLAAVPGCHLVRHFTACHNRFWADHVFSNQDTWFGKLLLGLLRKRLNRNMKRTRWWLTPLFTNYLKIYPYPIFHYHFESVVCSDSEALKIWNAPVKLSSRGPRSLKKHGYTAPVTASVLDRLKSCDAPLYKLDWRLDLGNVPGDALITHVLKQEGVWR